MPHVCSRVISRRRQRPVKVPPSANGGIAGSQGYIQGRKHCAGPLHGRADFAALKKAFGDRFLYAGLGTTLPLLLASNGSVMRRGEGPALRQDDLTTAGSRN